MIISVEERAMAGSMDLPGPNLLVADPYAVSCPKCLARPGGRCLSRGGRELLDPHTARRRAWVKAADAKPRVERSHASL